MPRVAKERRLRRKARKARRRLLDRFYELVVLEGDAEAARAALWREQEEAARAALARERG